MQHALLIHYIAAGSILVPITLSLVKFGKLTFPLKLLSTYLFLTMVLDIIVIFLARQGINNLFLFHLHTVLEVTAISLIYLQWFSNRRLWKIIIGTFVLLFSVFAVIDVVFIEGVHTFNSYPRGIAAVYFLSLCVALFLQMLSTLNVRQLERSSLFWINTGILIYAPGTLFLFIVSNYTLGNTDDQYWIIHSILNLLLNLSFATAIWINSKI
ncbi:MAG: hypothetical protein IIA45_11685 [Bacteroidetes bacterium]|nr:hypothetical protein [Bacteroidota bacterium]